MMQHTMCTSGTTKVVAQLHVAKTCLKLKREKARSLGASHVAWLHSVNWERQSAGWSSRSGRVAVKRRRQGLISQSLGFEFGSYCAQEVIFSMDAADLKRRVRALNNMDENQLRREVEQVQENVISKCLHSLSMQLKTFLPAPLVVSKYARIWFVWLTSSVSKLNVYSFERSAPESNPAIESTWRRGHCPMPVHWQSHGKGIWQDVRSNINSPRNDCRRISCTAKWS